MQRLSVPVDHAVLVGKRRLRADRLGESLLQRGIILGVDPTTEHLERHGVYIQVDIQNAVTFARSTGERGPRVPPIAAHPADLLTSDHPHIGLAQRLEQTYRFE
ncbi:hypothetical protein XH97_28205 [Bradyrhizobium sp. CCBAU 53380]|nr:hypothetical protein [Bradyrhizobium sp. CCBAU 53380]